MMTATEAFHVAAGYASGPMAAEDLLAKVHDRDLIKPFGFINGEFVGAADGSTIDVRLVSLLSTH